MYSWAVIRIISDEVKTNAPTCFVENSLSRIEYVTIDRKRTGKTSMNLFPAAFPLHFPNSFPEVSVMETL